MSKIKGIDISYWQGDVNFKKVAADGVKFAVLRDGYRKTIDQNFIEYVKGCQENGIQVMAYHFIYTDGATPKQNAQSAYNNIKAAGLDPTKVWIAADLEYDTWIKNGETCTKAKCTKYTKQFLNALEKLGCKKLFIYMNQDYYKNYYDWSKLDYPVWLADYQGEPNYPCVMQQYASNGTVSGINGYVDMNWLFDESMIKTSKTEKKTTKEEKTATEEKIKVAADTVISVAKAEVGYQEKASNSNLDSKTANAGFADYTKYARDFDQKYPNWYNGKKNGFAWCDMFVDWCFLTAFGYKKALELLCQPEKSAGAGCTYSYDYYKNKGQVGKIPKKGAQIFFGTPGDFSHTGLVYDFDDNNVYTIEGNSSDIVAYRQYSRNQTNIYYGYPNYTSSVAVSETSTQSSNKKQQETKTATSKKSIATIAQEVIDGKWGNGSNRKTKLETAGYNYDTIQKKVNELLKKNTKVSEITGSGAQSFSEKIARKYTTTENLNMRSGASTDAKIITTIPKGSVVTCYGYYTKDWYYVQYKNLAGFCNKTWLK